MVDISTSTAPGAAVFSTDPTTAVTSGLSGTIEQTTSAPSAASAGEPTTRHPVPASRAGSRDDTVTSCPASTNRRTIGAPIRPAPTNPTRMIPSTAPRTARPLRPPAARS